MKRKRLFDKRLQKALNHTNKLLYRLDQLDQTEESVVLIRYEGELTQDKTTWGFIWDDVNQIRRRILFAADARAIELDQKGMPR